MLEGHTRQEQQAFIALRSHYLFESHFCTPGQGHEKGGVEHSVGFGRRNFLVPIPKVASFAELNTLLLAECLKDDERQVDGQPVTIGEAWELEKSALRALPAKDYQCCVSRPVCLTPYSQVEFETNRYSVPTDKVSPASGAQSLSVPGGHPVPGGRRRQPCALLRPRAGCLRSAALPVAAGTAPRRLPACQAGAALAARPGRPSTSGCWRNCRPNRPVAVACASS